MTTDRAIILLDELRQCYGWGDVIITSDDAEALTMAIEALERDRWIPCEEMAPPDGDLLLTYSVHEEIKVLEHSEKAWWEDEQGYYCTDSHITHYRQLPEPPKEEEHDE